MSEDLRTSAASGVRWNALGMVFNVTVQFIVLTVLARLIRPEEFGVFALLVVVTEFGQLFADMGISAAVVRRRDATHEQLSSVYWLSLLVGAALSVAVVAIAPVMAFIYRQPRLLPLLPIVGVTFLVAASGQQFRLLLQRELRFRDVAKIEMIAVSFSAVTAITIAHWGGGVIALIASPLTAATVRSALLIQKGLTVFRPRLRLRRDDLRGFLSFGLFQMGERTLNYLVSRTDQILLGALIGARALGLYNFSTNLLAIPMMRLSGVLTDVAFPVLARLQDDRDALQRAYLRVLRTVMIINAPLLVGVAVVAPRLIPAVFGPQWVPATIYVQLLAVVMLFRAHGNPVGPLLLARGRADVGFRWVLAVVLCQTPLIVIGAWLRGAVGVAVALIVFQAAASTFNYIYLVRSNVGPCRPAYLRAILTPVSIALVMGGIVHLIHRVVSSGVAWLPLLIGAGAVVYVGLARVLLRADFDAVVAMVRPRGARLTEAGA